MIKVIAIGNRLMKDGLNETIHEAAKRGTAEQALVGTTIQNLEDPVELGRIIRSFDPCVSCATHVYIGGRHVKTIQVVS